MPGIKLVPVHISADTDNRIILPKHFSELLPWMTGKEVDAWLLLLQPGRHRLLSDEQVQSDTGLDAVRDLLVAGRPNAFPRPAHAQEVNRAAIVARLFPISIGLHKQSLRISLPRELRVFAPRECDTRLFSVLFSLEGYLEVWYTDVLRNAILATQPED